MDRKNRIIFVVLLIGGLFNVSHFLLYKYVPFVDHPSHLLRANIIRHYGNPEYEYDKYFHITFIPKPNILTDYLTADFALFMPIDYAGRLMWAIIVFSFPISVWFYIRQISPENTIWSLLALSLVWSLFISWGNQNFCFGSVLVFAFWGLLAKWNGNLSPKRVMGLTVFMTVLYLCHILAFVLGGLGVISHLITSGFRSLRTWLIHASVVLPGLIMLAILFAFSWYMNSGPFNPVSQETLPINSSLSFTDKFQAISFSITPIGFPYTYRLIWEVSCFLIFCFVIYRGVLSLIRKDYFPSVIVLVSIVVFVLLPNPFFFIDADRRILWIAVTGSLGLFPKVKSKTVVLIGVVSFLFCAYIHGNIAKWFTDSEKQLTKLEARFSTFPKKLRLAYTGELDFARGYLHRAFEYYHLRHGGFGTQHLIGWPHSVEYKKKRNSYIAINEFRLEYLRPYLSETDGFLIFARPQSQRANLLIRNLIKKNFILSSPSPFALILKPTHASQRDPEDR